jgi:Nif-specific regulatory protein
VTTHRVEQERDFLLQLITLPATQVDGYLTQVLEALVALTGALRGYVELYSTSRNGERRLSASVQCSAEDEAAIRSVTSRGIVGEAMAQGATVHTPAALLDERFARRESVQAQRLEAVLCVPFSEVPGVVYLERAPGRGPFTPEDVGFVERVTRFLGPVVAARAMAAAGGADATARFREQLKVDGLAGTSPALARVFEQVLQVAPVDISVLLMGESGTGKTALARAIHASSKRAAGPFIELNCAAIPETLVESELFGTKQGAFTGARTQPGKVELAEGGTLFLDEVGELPLAQQSKLLQLLSDKQYFRVGGAKVERANVRVLAATNADLSAMVASKAFRSDLWHRLSAFLIRLPALRERAEDLGPLVDDLLERVARDHEAPVLPATSSLRTLCQVQEWPGNVRELRNRLEQAVLRARAEGSLYVEGRHLDEQAPAGQTLSMSQATTAFQRDLLKRELATSGWNVTETGRRLDLSRQQLHNLIKAFGLKRE